MYSHEHDEWRDAVNELTETDRILSCGHSCWTHGPCCPDCGTTKDEL